MPTYTFKDKTTGKTEDIYMEMSQREIFLEQNPHLVQTHEGVAPGLIRDSGMGNVRKPSEGFREVLRTIKKKHPRSNINTF